MRAPTRVFLQQLPNRKRATLVVLFAVMCGGIFAGGSALA